MMATWHRQPTGDEETIGNRPRSALVRWVAAGPLSTKEARDDPNFPIAFNAPHPDYGSSDPRRARAPRIVASGFRVISVEARFEIPSNGTSHQPQEPDQTNPLVFSWQTIQEGVAIDRDRSGNPILTAMRRGVQGLTQTRNYKRLTVTRWQSSYSNTQAMNYENTVSSTTFEGAAAGEVKCSIIQPSQSYTAADALVPVDHVFDFKAASIWGAQPWQTLFLHRESYAKADGKIVRIVTAGGEPVTDVLMNASGQPVDTSLTYFEAATDNEPVDSPSWDSVSLPSGATATTAGGAVMLRYLTLPEKDLNGLGLS